MYVARPEALGWIQAVAVIGKGALDIFGKGEAAKGEAAAYREIIAQQEAARKAAAETPDWVLPAALIGGVALLAILISGGKKPTI